MVVVMKPAADPVAGVVAPVAPATPADAPVAVDKTPGPVAVIVP